MPDPTLVSRGPLQTQTGADVPRLQNFIGGRWVQSTASDWLDVHNPALGSVIAKAPLSTGRDLDAAVTAARQAFPGWSETPPVVRARDDVPRSRRCSRSTSRSWPASSPPSTARRSTRRAAASAAASSASRWPAARPSLLMGYGLENIATEHRLHGDAAADRRHRGDRAVQLPGDGAAVVPALRGGLRQHLHRQAVRAGAALAAADVPAARAVRPAARRRQPGQRRPRGRRSDLRPSRDQGRVVRRLDAGGAARLPARHPRRQALPGARRRQELHHRDAGRGSRSQHPDHHRVVLRLRRRALPGRQRAAAGRRRAQAGPRSADRRGARR